MADFDLKRFWCVQYTIQHPWHKTIHKEYFDTQEAASTFVRRSDIMIYNDGRVDTPRRKMLVKMCQVLTLLYEGATYPLGEPVVVHKE